MKRSRVTFTRKAEGPGGRGFEQIRHTALLDGREIGSWAGAMSLSTVGTDNRAFLPYRDWLARVKQYAETLP
jgi:hypothetical protein